MVVALIALVMATTGSAVAAVSFATNAGAVDGKSAVASGALTKTAAGRLVATQKTGDDRGQIATKYLDLDGYARGATSTFGKAFEVPDNQTLAPEPIGGIFGLGTLTASCFDQSTRAGVEDPATRVIFVNQSGNPVNVSRTVGNGDPFVGALLNGTQTEFVIGGSSTFELHIQRGGTNYFVQGTVRQDGRNTPGATCLVYGFSISVES